MSWLSTLNEIDVESSKNGHKEFECSLYKLTSNDEESVKTHLENYVPKPPEKSSRAAKTKKVQELIINAGSLLDWIVIAATTRGRLLVHSSPGALDSRGEARISVQLS